MKISSSTYTTITGIAPKVIETSNGFMLNTQYYTKERLSPVPFETCYLIGSPYSLSIRKQLFLQNYSWNYPNDEFNIVKDSRYENRYYMRTLEGYISGSRSSKLITFEEIKNGEIKILNVYNSGDYQFLEFVGQNDSYIWWTLRSNTLFYLFRMNKITYEVVSCWSSSAGYNYGKLKQIYSDDMYIYFIYFAEQNIYTLKYNKVNNSTSVSKAIYRGKEASTYNYYLTNISDTPYKIDDNTYGLFLYNAANQEQPIDLYSYDTTKTFADGFTMQHVSIAWGNGKNKIDFIHNSSLYSTIRNFISEFNGIKYLNVVVYQMNYDNSNYILI